MRFLENTRITGDEWTLVDVERSENGTPYRARTCDLRLRRPLLYPTELRAHWDAATWGCGWDYTVRDH